MCTVRLFSQGVDLFALKFYLDRVVPINHSLHQKTRDTGLPNGEDRNPLRSLILTQYRSVTDRRTDGFVVAYIALAKLALRARCKNYLVDRLRRVGPGTLVPSVWPPLKTDHMTLCRQNHPRIR